VDKVETQFPPVQKSDRWIWGGVWGHSRLYTRWVQNRKVIGGSEVVYEAIFAFIPGVRVVVQKSDRWIWGGVWGHAPLYTCIPGELFYRKVIHTCRWIRGGVWCHSPLYTCTRWDGMSGMEIIKFGCVLTVLLCVHFYTPISKRDIWCQVYFATRSLD
jgi:hypothetical protein